MNTKITLKRKRAATIDRMLPKIKATDLLKLNGETVVELFDYDFLAWGGSTDNLYLYANEDGLQRGIKTSIRSLFSIAYDEHTHPSDDYTRITPTQYSSSTNYMQGHFVTYSSRVFRCKGDNTQNQTPPATATSNVYWEYIGSTVNLNGVLGRLADTTNGKVNLSILEGVAGLSTSAPMRPAPTLGVTLLQNPNIPSYLKDIFNFLDFTSEDTVKQEMNQFVIITNEYGFAKQGADASGHVYNFSAIEPSEDFFDADTLKLYSGDMLVLQAYVKDSPSAGLYTLTFGVVSHTERLASTTQKGMVQLNNNPGPLRRYDLESGFSSPMNIIDEAKLREIMRDALLYIKIDLGAAYAGMHVYSSVDQVIDLSAGGTPSNNDLGFVGSTAVKVIYKYNSTTSQWEDTGDTITLPFADFILYGVYEMVQENNKKYIIKTMYNILFDNTTQAELTDFLEDDLIMEMDDVITID